MLCRLSFLDWISFHCSSIFQILILRLGVCQISETMRVKKPSLAWLIGISQLLITVAYFAPTLLGIVQSNDRHDYEFLGRRPFLLHNLRVSPHRIKVTWSSYKGLMVSK